MAFLRDVIRGAARSASEQLPGILQYRQSMRQQQAKTAATEAESRQKQQQAVLKASIDDLTQRMQENEGTINTFMAEGDTQGAVPFIREYNDLAKQRQGYKQQYIQSLGGMTRARILPGTVPETMPITPSPVPTAGLRTQGPIDEAATPTARPPLGKFAAVQLKGQRERQKDELSQLTQETTLHRSAWNAAKEHVDETGAVGQALAIYEGANPLATPQQRQQIERYLSQRAAPSYKNKDELEALAYFVYKNPQTMGQFASKDRVDILKKQAEKGWVYKDPLPPTQLVALAEGDHALFELGHLAGLVEENPDFFGPIAGRLYPLFYGTELKRDSQKLIASMDRAKQMVGKYLEGGVLRAEDEKKYQRILATVTDDPEVATYKIRSIIKSLKFKRDRQLYYFSMAGYQTPNRISDADIATYKLDLPLDPDESTFDEMMWMANDFPELIPEIKKRYPDRWSDLQAQNEAEKAK